MTMRSVFETSLGRQRRSDRCLELLHARGQVRGVPRDDELVRRIEVGMVGVFPIGKHVVPTREKDRPADALRKARFPVGAAVAVGEVAHHEAAGPNLHAHSIVDRTGLLLLVVGRTNREACQACDSYMKTDVFN